MAPNRPSFNPEKMKRNILVIFTNRLNSSQPAQYLEVDCDDEGNVLEERPLSEAPTEARYHEVWENDEGKFSFSSCHRFKRKYRHRLEKSRG
jgi:hypothetical protein